MYIFNKSSEEITYNTEMMISMTLNAFHYKPKINIEDLEFIDGTNFYIPPNYHSNDDYIVTTKVGKLYILISSLFMLYDSIQNRLYSRNDNYEYTYLNSISEDNSEYDDKCIEYYYAKIKKVFKDNTGLNIVLSQNMFDNLYDNSFKIDTHKLMSSIIKFSNTYYGFEECIKDIIFSDNIHICLDSFNDTNIISNCGLLQFIKKEYDLYKTKYENSNIDYNGRYLNIYNGLHLLSKEIEKCNADDFSKHEFDTYVSVIGIEGFLNYFEAWVKLKERNKKLYENN